MDISKFNLFGVVFNFKDKAARDKNTTQDSTLETHGTDIDGLKVPTFSEPAANTDVRTAVAGIKSKTAIGTLFTNIKAALNGLVTLGEMRNYLVNNGTVTETGKYFLDAAYGKTLLDQITALKSEFNGYIHVYGDLYNKGEGTDNLIPFLNKIKDAGFHMFRSVSGNTENPTQSSCVIICHIFNFQESGLISDGVMLGFSHGNVVHMRTCLSGTWSSWKQIG